MSGDPEEVRARVTARLAELRAELRQGEAMLRELVQKEAALRESMLRIAGAVQVLEEVLGAPPTPSGNGAVGLVDAPPAG